MKAKRLEIETCKGLVALSDVVYHFISEDILEIHFSYSILIRPSVYCEVSSKNRWWGSVQQ
jgi:hypothetical protein